MKFDLANTFEAAKCEVYFDKLKKIEAKIELKKIAKKRSISQNSYFHVVVSIYAINLGYTLDEAKMLLKRMYAKVCKALIYEKKGNKFYLSTSSMNSKELTEFIDWIRTHSAKDCGVYIPTSEEYLINCYAIDKEINQNKEYL